jgi:hypothetical protein
MAGRLSRVDRSARIAYPYELPRHHRNLENLMAAATKTADISKIDAVRKAMEELGKKAMPGEIQEYVKEKFGLEMSMSHVSNCKSALRKKKRRKAAAAGEAESAPAPAAAPVKAASAPAGDESVSMGDIAAVKELVGRVGEDKLKSLIGLLG